MCFYVDNTPIASLCPQRFLKTDDLDCLIQRRSKSLLCFISNFIAFMFLMHGMFDKYNLINILTNIICRFMLTVRAQSDGKV